MNPIYPPQAGSGQHQQPGMHHDMHHTLPAIGQTSSYHHALPQLPSMPSNMPQQQPYADHYGMITPQEQQPPTPTSESHQSKLSPEKIQRKIAPHIGELDGRAYRLDVVQQPKRARMCGFGDKDRRPITPPPCVRLVVTDIATGKEIDCNEIEHALYVLNVDLWSEDAQMEVNLVRHTTATPSISATTPASFAQIDQPSPAYAQILPNTREAVAYANQGNFSPSVTPYASGGYGPTTVSPVSYNMVSNGYVQQGGFYGPGSEMHSPMGSQGAMSPYGPGPSRLYGGSQDMMGQRMSLQGGQSGPQGMFTRNLIGSLCASAFRLTDQLDKIGIWFVLQDLSVRTEGSFRLRFSFVNVGPPTRAPNGAPANTSSIVNTGKAPVLASCFSDVFQVFSAKKFPGVCESTGLSKCFAGQGIKIPIRKEGHNKGGDDDDDD